VKTSLEMPAESMVTEPPCPPAPVEATHCAPNLATANDLTMSVPNKMEFSEEEVLNLVVHPDENVWMSQIGHLRSWFGNKTRYGKIAVPAVAPQKVAANVVSSFYLFNNLQRLDLNFDSASYVVQQNIFCAVAELMHLSSCSITGGRLPSRDLNLSVLSSLTRLEELSIVPCSEDGLHDEHMSGLVHASTTLKSLSIRGSAEFLSDAGVLQLTALQGLTQLSVMPLGLEVTREGLAKVHAGLPSLKNLSVGLQQAGQVAALRDLSDLPTVTVVVNDHGASPSEINSFVSTCTLCLCTSLVSLRLGTLKAHDASFMVAIGALSNLTELKMAVMPATVGTPDLSCDLTVLSCLKGMASLDFACTSRVELPFTPRTVSILALAWPKLQSLALSIMAKQELVPEALGLMDLFSSLQRLNLFCPLDFDRDEASESDDPTEVSLQVCYLPRGLQHLQLEHAMLTVLSSTRSCEVSGGGDEKSAAAGGGAAAAWPAGLVSVELEDCTASDAVLTDLVASASGLKHMELNEVRGLSDAGFLAALAALRHLEYLVVLSAADATSLVRTTSGQGWGGPQEWTQPTGVTNRCFPHLSEALSHSAGSLRHFEWVVGSGLTPAQILTAAPTMSGLGSLRFMYIYTTPGAPDPLSGQDNDNVAGAPIIEVSNSMTSNVLVKATGGWRAEVGKRLPLCTVTDDSALSLVMYDPYSGRMVHVSGVPCN